MNRKQNAVYKSESNLLVDSKHPLKDLMNSLGIWGSIICFLALYTLQKGNGIVEMESPFFRGELDRAQVYHTSLQMVVSSLVFICIVFVYMWKTKTQRNPLLHGGGKEWCIAIFSLSIFVLKGALSKPAECFQYAMGNRYVSLIILVVLAALSLPCILFVLSWIQEKSRLKPFSKGRYGKVFFMVCANISMLGLLLAGYCSFSLDIWNDEMFTLRVVKLNWLALAGFGVYDVHPPLYLAIFKIIPNFIQYFFPSIPFICAAKLTALLPHIILAIICMTVVRSRWGYYVGGLGAISMVCMPLMIYHSQELRLYSWTLLWITCTWLCVHGVCCGNRMRDWIGFIVFTVLTLYTLYSACIVIAVMWTFVAFWCLKHGELKKCLYAAGAVFLAFLPWLPIMLARIISTEKGYWMPPMTCTSFMDLMLSPTRDVLLVSLIVVIGVFSFLDRKYVRSIHTLHALLGMSLVFLVVITMCGVSYIGTPIITPRVRYVVPMLGCLWLGALIACSKYYRLQILMSAMIFFVSISELYSFSCVQTEGARGAEMLTKFIEKNEPVELISALVKPEGRLETKYRVVTAMSEKSLYTFALEDNNKHVEYKLHDSRIIIESRTRAKIERYGIPEFLSPMLKFCFFAFYHIENEFEKHCWNWSNAVSPQDIRGLLESGKTMYCIGMKTHYNEPDIEATEKLLMKSNIKLNRIPALQCNICSGAHTVFLYKLELETPSPELEK